MPLRHAYVDHPRGRPRHRRGIARGQVMIQIAPSLNRRRLLQAGGAVVISFSTVPLLGDPASAAGTVAGAAHVARPPLTPDPLDSFIALQSDGTVVAYYGKMDPGQGVDVAIGQIVAEELDLP